ncbi:MAG: phosphate ABC transporter permease subunit PstC [Deltaproteobacteria bacterium]|nr:MAG: phosphate ABC transporter permease subunit PstC [Deltaproteobacteria bacterium]
MAVAQPRREAAPPRRRHNLPDRAWGASLGVLGVAVLVVALLILSELWRVAKPLLATTGISRFVSTSQWDVVRETYGALPFIYGTLVTSAIALVLALPISVGLALFLTEMSPPRFRAVVSFPISLLAGIPSVVFGLWGLFVLVPILRHDVEPFLARTLGFLPLFQGPRIGLGYLAAGAILAIMILPTITSIAIEVLRTVPLSLREAALALGATRWETIRIAVLPYARAGILGATILGLGRALGETMAVTMVIGNSPTIRASLFAPGYSLPAVLANEFAEASSGNHTAALAALGLLLFVVTLLLNVAARVLVRIGTRGPRRVAA